MTDRLPEIDSWPLAARLAGQIQGTWTVLVPQDQSEIGVRDFIERLGALLRKPAREVRVGKAEEVIDAVATAPSDVPLIFLGLDAFDAESWRHLDANRSRLERTGHSVAVVSEACIGTMAEQAPNLWSWIGASAWQLRTPTELSPEARAARLVALRERFGFEDEELIRRAERGALKSDPHLSEWLVLIGRSDLVSRMGTRDAAG